MTTSESETIKSSPKDLSKGGEYTEDISSVVESQYEEPTALTRAVATYLSKNNDGRTRSKDEMTQRVQKKFSKFKKELGHIFSDLRLCLRILFFLASIGTLILAFTRFSTLSVQLVEEYGDIPNCVFQWGEWSECSAPCSTPTQNATRTRYVIPETVVDMSNVHKDSSIFNKIIYVYYSLHKSKCYDILQTSLCNVYECPVNLSTLTNWTKCQFNIVSPVPSEQQCLQYRELPPRGLVRIDTPAEMYRICDCADAKYPF